MAIRPEDILKLKEKERKRIDELEEDLDRFLYENFDGSKIKYPVGNIDDLRPAAVSELVNRYKDGWFIDCNPEQTNSTEIGENEGFLIFTPKKTKLLREESPESLSYRELERERIKKERGIVKAYIGDLEIGHEFDIYKISDVTGISTTKISNMMGRNKEFFQVSYDSETKIWKKIDTPNIKRRKLSEIEDMGALVEEIKEIIANYPDKKFKSGDIADRIGLYARPLANILNRNAKFLGIEDLSSTGYEHIYKKV